MRKITHDPEKLQTFRTRSCAKSKRIASVVCSTLSKNGVGPAMYQAIVFLPLLGSIIAAFIALAGAHARHPGGSPPPLPEGAEDHIVGTAIQPPHGVPSAAGGGTVIHAS